MAHTIEVFTGGCLLCSKVLEMVEVGKCASCVLIERDLTAEAEAHTDLVHRYGIHSVPTIVVDGRIKVEGKPDFPWLCGDEFYAWLEKTHPLH